MKRQEAISRGLIEYTPDNPCKRGHIRRRTSSGDCIECVRHRDTKRKDDVEKYLLIRKRANAKYLGIDFDFTLDDIVIPEKCPVLDITLEMNNKRGGCDNSPSIDRVDPSKGYVRGNIQIISNKANRLKSDLTVYQIEKLLSYMKDCVD